MCNDKYKPSIKLYFYIGLQLFHSALTSEVLLALIILLLSIFLVEIRKYICEYDHVRHRGYGYFDPRFLLIIKLILEF